MKINHGVTHGRPAALLFSTLVMGLVIGVGAAPALAATTAVGPASPFAATNATGFPWPLDAPGLAVPLNHPGGTAAALTASKASCLTCHPGLPLPTTGEINHTGIGGVCITCHTFVDASPIVEPADHADHDRSWSCGMCHGTLVAAIKPTTDNTGDVAPSGQISGHYLGSDPTGTGSCTDCHGSTYEIASETPVPTGISGIPALGIPIDHPGGTAAVLRVSNLSCLTCHPGMSLPTTGAINHAALGITTGCSSCHTLVDASAITEPANHAGWASVSCGMCHNAAFLGPIMPPVDNTGDVAPSGQTSGHYLGSDPTGSGVCADCHDSSYAIASADTTPPTTTCDAVSTYVESATITLTAVDNAGGSGVASTHYTLDGAPDTIGTSVTVTTLGSHVLVCWSVDNAGNVEAHHAVDFTITAAPPIATALTVSASPASVKLPQPFVLSGALSVPTNGLPCVVYVKKPGSSRWSYSSNRGTYAAAASSSLWWYRYTPKLKGTYSFYVSYAGDATHLTATSKIVAVTVK
jgi:hypothetical protein